MTKITEWEWKPLISVGILRFGKSIETIISEFNLHKLDKPFEEFELDSYDFPDHNKIVCAEGGYITIIGCFDELYYKGENLFGLTLDEIRSRLGEEDEIGKPVLFDFEDGEYEKISVEFYKYGLQIWIRDGVVESAMLSAA
jgi:hypothetical protein